MPVRTQLISRRLIPNLAIALFAWTASEAYANPPSADLTRRLAEGGRSSADKARDARRQPAEVINFLGIEAGMKVMDLIAAGGYYTEVLSEAVGPKGRVYAQNGDFVLKISDGANDKAMTARLANGRLPNVERLDREVKDLSFDGTLDAVLTALNFHDIYNDGGADAVNEMLTKILNSLRPGGVLGLIDHAGNPKVNNEKLHRVDEAKVVEAAKAAGFIAEASSDILRHPEDDRTQFVFANGLRGATDRFVLRLRKPR